MKLTEIFTSELTDVEKVDAISKVITKAREAYGNIDADIEAPEMQTVNGLENLNMLCDESKLVIAQSEIASIKTVASEYCKAYDGAIFSRKVEELLAISPVLANIAVPMPDNNYL